jgi:hypothetical protein
MDALHRTLKEASAVSGGFGLGWFHWSYVAMPATHATTAKMDHNQVERSIPGLFQVSRLRRRFGGG